MISYNYKLIIFTIILGILSLINNSYYDRLYKNTKYKSVLLGSTNFRSLSELLHEPRANNIYECNQLTECGFTNEKKYKKNKYPIDDAKTKQKIPEKVNTQTTNSKKYKKGKYNKEKEAKSNRSSRSIKYLEMQRKLYNNFYVKPEIYFEHLSHKSNDKYCEYTNTKISSRKGDDKYLDNLKTGCVGGAGMCTSSSTATGIAGNCFAAAANGVSSLTGGAAAKGLAGKIIKDSTLLAAYTPFGIAALVLILIVIVLMILYVWLRRRRKNSWKYECKKHLCT
ncbi:PIR protein,putative [Plasmodium sp.]|nr:PIR protein,putative [Plasmodium sp.]